MLLMELVHPLHHLHDAVASVDVGHQLLWLLALVLELDEQVVDSAEIGTLVVVHLTDVGLQLQAQLQDVLVEAEDGQQQVQHRQATHRLLQFLRAQCQQLLLETLSYFRRK